MNCIKKYLAIISMAVLEILRQPISYLIITTSIVLIGISPFILMHDFGENGKIIRDSSFAFQLIFGMFICGYAACTALAREIRSGTASVILSKPVSRELFYLSKFMGVLVIAFIFVYLTSLSGLIAEKSVQKFLYKGVVPAYYTDQTSGLLFLLSVIISAIFGAILNYWKKIPFASSSLICEMILLSILAVATGYIDIRGNFVGDFILRLDLRMLRVNLLIAFALIIFCALGLLFSTRLSSPVTMSMMLVVLLFGLMSYYFFGDGAGTWSLSGFLYGIVPDWQNYWVCDALNGGGNIPFGYILDIGLYSLIYTIALLFSGIYLFKNSQVN